MNILIPMAGAGSRFVRAGYELPKPFIDVSGIPMISRVINNINMKEHHHIFLVRKEHQQQYPELLSAALASVNSTIVTVDHLTEGAACTTLLAETFIDTSEPLLIVNSDQLVNWDSIDFQLVCNLSGASGVIATFHATESKWSYAKVLHGNVVEVAEKNPISDRATVGIYYWAQGSDYVKYAKQMIAKNIRTNNEFYVCPVFNEAIRDGKRIIEYPVSNMQGLGTPEDLEHALYQNNIQFN